MSEQTPQNPPSGSPEPRGGVPPIPPGLPPEARLPASYPPVGGIGGGPMGGGLPPESRVAASLPPEARTPTAAVQTAAEPVSPTPRRKKEEDNSLAGVIDTVEAIIIALILALTFRAFVVEAFVIPTGSMAPTLLGAHFKVICPKCGYSFDENADLNNQFNPQTQHIESYDRGDLHDSTAIPAPATQTCPNCGFVIPASKLPDDPLVRTFMRGGTRYPVHFPWVDNGDRILVLKYLYSFLAPERFDVIVFKEPMHARDNYIKRLIGLPGETIQIIGGDVYAGQGEGAVSDPAQRKIVRKPPRIQETLWQLVYDNDHYPTDEDKERKLPDEKIAPAWHNPWAGAGATAAAWDIRGPVVRYTDAAPGELRFTIGASPDNAHTPYFYTYNVLGYNNDMSTSEQRYPVGDLHLETVWTPTGEGREGLGLSIALGQEHNLFRVHWSREGKLDLERYDRSARRFAPVADAGSVSGPVPQAGHAYRVSMDNVDHAVRFCIDGRACLAYQMPWTAKDALAVPEGDEHARPRIELDVSGPCTLGHLKLMRDVYYTQADIRPTNQDRNVEVGPGTGTRDNPVTLGPDEFFALGDNSTRSLDGRGWPVTYPALDDLGTRRGIVPRRYLLGKAFFVYWPAGFRPMKQTGIPLIPNTGEMRFIR